MTWTALALVHGVIVLGSALAFLLLVAFFIELLLHARDLWRERHDD